MCAGLGFASPSVTHVSAGTRQSLHKEIHCTPARRWQTGCQKGPGHRKQSESGMWFGAVGPIFWRAYLEAVPAEWARSPMAVKNTNYKNEMPVGTTRTQRIIKREPPISVDGKGSGKIFLRGPCPNSLQTLVGESHLMILVGPNAEKGCSKSCNN